MNDFQLMYISVIYFQKVEQKIDCIRQKFNDIAKEEIEWTYSTTAIMFMCKKQRKTNLLACCVTAQNTDIKYRYMHRYVN